MYPDPKGQEQSGNGNGNVNYLRKPRSEIGTASLFAASVSLALTVLVFYLMVASLGNPPLYVSAIAGSAMLFSLYALISGILSLLDPDKNHLLGIIGLSIGGLVFLIWIITVIIGMTQ